MHGGVDGLSRRLTGKPRALPRGASRCITDVRHHTACVCVGLRDSMSCGGGAEWHFWNASSSEEVHPLYSCHAIEGRRLPPGVSDVPAADRIRFAQERVYGITRRVRARKDVSR